MKALILTLIAIFCIGPGSLQAQHNIRLEVIDGCDWLIDPSGKPFFPHGVNHIDRHGAGEGAKAVSTACKDLGFNAYGYGCPNELHDDLPYLESWNDLVPMSLHRSESAFRFYDIFDPEVQHRIEAQIAATCAKGRENHNLIGYLWTDLAAWPLKNTKKPNWVDFMRGLPDTAPGQQAYQAFVKTKTGGDSEFLRLIARQYFKVLGEATRKHDPNHLIFGDRFIFSTVVPEVIEEMLPYVDAIAIQPFYAAGFPRTQFEELHAQTKKPILICDFAIRFEEEGKDINGGELVKDEIAAGQAYCDYIREARATSFIIGAFWCNLIESPWPIGSKGVKQGLFRTGLTPRPALHEQIRKLNEDIATSERALRHE